MWQHCFSSPCQTVNSDGFFQAKEGELSLINQLLEEPNLTSKKFREWKQRHHELYMDIFEYSPGDNSTGDLSPLATPLMAHTHSFIETHV